VGDPAKRAIGVKSPSAYRAVVGCPAHAARCRSCRCPAGIAGVGRRQMVPDRQRGLVTNHEVAANGYQGFHFGASFEEQAAANRGRRQCSCDGPAPWTIKTIAGRCPRAAGSMHFDRDALELRRLVLGIACRGGAGETSLFAHRAYRHRSRLGVSGTSGSNPLSSSAESRANLTVGSTSPPGGSSMIPAVSTARRPLAQ
jgi:hypothetical protein